MSIYLVLMAASMARLKSPAAMPESSISSRCLNRKSGAICHCTTQPLPMTPFHLCSKSWSRIQSSRLVSDNSPAWLGCTSSIAVAKCKASSGVRSSCTCSNRATTCSAWLGCAAPISIAANASSAMCRYTKHSSPGRACISFKAFNAICKRCVILLLLPNVCKYGHGLRVAPTSGKLAQKQARSGQRWLLLL